MSEHQLNQLWQKIYRKLQQFPWRQKLEKLRQSGLSFISSWWKMLLGGLAAVIFLYYPFGGWLIHDIDTTLDYEINTPAEQSAAVEMTAFLIKREVDDKLWTPNLPVIFPSYFLDNMPAFQLGEISALSHLTTAFSRRLEKTIAGSGELHLQAAAEYLRYPGTIWLFSPANKLTPVPSANSQYRKARRELIAYNRELRSGAAVFYKSPADLRFFIKRLEDDLLASAQTLESRIREHAGAWLDTGADDAFYFQKGKLYAYYLLTSALGRDYKEVIVAAEAYPAWTVLCKALEEGARLDPFFVRNGRTDSLTAPNHLAVSGFYTLKAAAAAREIINKLNPALIQDKKQS